MTKPKLLLHPGSSQGGSTWIQNLCNKNPEALKAQGFHYLNTFLGMPLDDLASDDPAPVYDMMERMLEGDDVPEDEAATVFLSNERALGDPLYAEGLFAQAPRMARNILPMLDHFSQVKVIYVWRPIDRFLLSVYNQRKKQGSKITFAGFAETMAERSYDSRHVIEALRILSERAEINVIDFDFLTRRPRRFAANFFGLAGVTLPADFDYAQGGRNPSIREEGIRILEHAKDFLSKKEYVELRKFVQAKFPKTEFSEEEQAFLDAWADRSRENEKKRLAELEGFARLIRLPAEA